MLFNSYEFLLVFLPVCLIVFALFVKFRSSTPAIAWLTFVSFAFYGYWTPAYLPLFAGSILANYFLSSQLIQCAEGSRKKQALLTLGVVVNLGFLAWFKYAGFFLDVVGVGRSVIGDVILPLGISFYTFHQLAYLIGVYYDSKKHCGLLDYSFYVAFFPQLIAGPITRPHEVLPQIRDRKLNLTEENFAVGLTIFAIGLVKKVMLADAVAKYADQAFDPSAAGESVPMLVAWLGMFAYTMQLYFDFSGYSDMAIGLARMFGVKLPLNFNAPYQARSIAHFWRRWHMTLSRLLRDGLYIPLGGNRVAPWRRYFNALAVMTIGGLWHGAGWTFILWGAAHGTFLAVNHAWSDLSKKHGWTFTKTNPAWKTFAWALTFMCVCLTWVLFRAESLEAAGNMYSSLVGANGFLPAKIQRTGLIVTGLLMLIAFFAPTTQRLMAKFEPALDYNPTDDEAQPLPALARWSWRPSLAAALAVGAALVACTMNLGGVQEFLYFNF